MGAGGRRGDPTSWFWRWGGEGGGDTVGLAICAVPFIMVRIGVCLLEGPPMKLRWVILVASV